MKLSNLMPQSSILNLGRKAFCGSLMLLALSPVLSFAQVLPIIRPATEPISNKITEVGKCEVGATGEVQVTVTSKVSTRALLINFGGDETYYDQALEETRSSVYTFTGERAKRDCIEYLMYLDHYILNK